MRLPSFSNATLRAIDPMPLLWGVLAIAAFQFGLGLYATALNELFYARYGPFFDSLSYYNSLAQMQISAREQGVIPALVDAIYRSTVVYPWVLFAPFARHATLFRGIGVWIQIFAAAWMQLAIFFYFLRVRACTWIEAFAFSAAFVLIAAAFDINGGLSDFRMDLLQYLLFTTMMATYLIARRLDTLVWWALVGLSAGFLCLGRTTSPVYLIPIFAALAAFDLIIERSNRRWVLVRWLVVGLIATTIAGWYFVSHFKYLYYYYAIWNEAATARLPLAESVGHLVYARKHVGSRLLWPLAFVALLTLAFSIRIQGAATLKHLNWRPLLFSAIPLGYLVLSGSGVNPFVSIVGTAGIIMFLLDPLDDARPQFPSWVLLIVVVALLVGGLSYAATSIDKHSRENLVAVWMPRQAGIGAVVQILIDAISRDGQPRTYRYSFVHLAGLNQSVIFNTMVFDRRIPHVRPRTAIIGGAQLAEANLQNNSATAVDWAKLPGDTDEQKITYVVRSFEEKTDFLVTSIEGTGLPDAVFISRFVPEINRRILASGRWEQIGGPINVSPIEKVIVLRNRGRSGDPQ
jgi:hypothetical protein